MAKPIDIRGITLLTEQNLPAAWNRQREFIPIAVASSPATTIVKISVLPMRMKDALAAARNSAEHNDLRWAAMARGLGVIYLALLPAERNEDAKARTAKVTDAIHATCAELGGHSTVPWCPADWKIALKIWGPPRPDFALMQKLKRVFDAHGVLSPGRFVGGI
jgi:FAD/FMN-containing dehydrogenase